MPSRAGREACWQQYSTRELDEEASDYPSVAPKTHKNRVCARAHPRGAGAQPSHAAMPRMLAVRAVGGHDTAEKSHWTAAELPPGVTHGRERQTPCGFGHAIGKVGGVSSFVNCAAWQLQHAMQLCHSSAGVRTGGRSMPCSYAIPVQGC
eukprot:25681-Chlamydomonas_euryale.AAC.7